MIPVSTSVLMVLLKPLRVLSAVQLLGNFGSLSPLPSKSNPTSDGSGLKGNERIG